MLNIKQIVHTNFRLWHINRDSKTELKQNKETKQNKKKQNQNRINFTNIRLVPICLKLKKKTDQNQTGNQIGNSNIQNTLYTLKILIKLFLNLSNILKYYF